MFKELILKTGQDISYQISLESFSDIPIPSETFQMIVLAMLKFKSVTNHASKSHENVGDILK